MKNETVWMEERRKRGDRRR